MNGHIEISQPVVITAAIHFWIDPAEWNAMSDEAKRDMIAEKVQTAGIRCDNDTIQCDGSVNMSATITGPHADQIDLTKIEIYDPA